MSIPGLLIMTIISGLYRWLLMLCPSLLYFPTAFPSQSCCTHSMAKKYGYCHYYLWCLLVSVDMGPA